MSFVKQSQLKLVNLFRLFNNCTGEWTQSRDGRLMWTEAVPNGADPNWSWKMLLSCQIFCHSDVVLTPVPVHLSSCHRLSQSVILSCVFLKVTACVCQEIPWNLCYLLLCLTCSINNSPLSYHYGWVYCYLSLSHAHTRTHKSASVSW